MRMTEDRDIAAQIRAGGARGFRLLYGRHAARVFGFAWRLTGERTEAEDLVQEVFAAAYAGRASFQGRAQPLTWLLGIAARRWRDRGRRCAPDTTPLDTGAELSSPGPSLEGAVVNEVTLSQALTHLAPPLREALLLVASQGLTYREAAGALGEPVGTVKWRVHEATRRMRALLRAVEEECDALSQT